MAIGDAALAAGMDIVNGATTPANTIDTEENKTRDYIATGAGAVSAATANKVVKRDASGRARFADPSNAADAATKGYVDNVGDSAATANKVVKRDGSGRARFADPSNVSDAATKGYVDNTAGSVAAAADSLARRTALGRLRVADPGSETDAATPKSYVDAAVSAGASHSHSAADITSGTLARPVSTSGSGRFGAAWGNNIVSTRRAVWMEADGTLGHTASARKFKQDIRPAELTFEQLRAIPVVLYRYRKQVAAEKAGKIDHAATEIGTLADDLHELDLWQFVIYDDAGAPLSVHYELLALAALSLGQQLADRLDAFEARLSALEES
jgi:hypothetical protein